MTDKEELIALLTKWGVPFTNDCTGFSGNWMKGIDSGIRVTAGDDHSDSDKRPKNWGYDGFYTEFYFAEDGSFTAMGAWE
jgi:hypothetical protein